MENVINFDLLKEYDGTLKEVLKVWQKEKSYSVYDTIQYKGNYLKCTTAGTSGTTTLDFTGVEVGDTITDGTVVWEVIEPPSSGGVISIWQANTAYKVNDVVIDSNLIWQCATAHTSSTTFDESKWICISGGEVSNGLEIVTLWEGLLRFNDNTPQQLNDNISNYDFLLFNLGTGSNRGSSITEIIDIKDLSSTAYYRLFGGHPDYIWQAEIRFSSSTQFYISDYIERNNIDPYIYKVQGIRKAKPIVSSGMKYVTLWEGSVGSIDGDVSDVNITLNDVYTKYRKIGISVNFGGSSVSQRYYEFNSSEITTNSNIMIPYGLGTSEYRVGGFKSVNQTTLTAGAYNHAVITKVIGISEGVQIPTGVQAARVTLYTGNSVPSANSTIQLVDDYRSYDKLELIIGTSIDGRYGFSSEIVDVNKLLDTANTSNRCIVTSFNNANIELWYNLDTTKIIVTSNVVLYEIVGIKYIQPDSYSTEEKLIGTWIDGKPLYRKVFENPTNGMNTGINNTDYNIKKLYGGAIQADMPSVHFDIPYFANGVGAWVYSVNGALTIGASFSCVVQWVAIEYTKN